MIKGGAVAAPPWPARHASSNLPSRAYNHLPTSPVGLGTEIYIFLLRSSPDSHWQPRVARRRRPDWYAVLATISRKRLQDIYLDQNFCSKAPE